MKSSHDVLNDPRLLRDTGDIDPADMAAAGAAVASARRSDAMAAAAAAAGEAAARADAASQGDFAARMRERMATHKASLEKRPEDTGVAGGGGGGAGGGISDDADGDEDGPMQYAATQRGRGCWNTRTGAPAR